MSLASFTPSTSPLAGQLRPRRLFSIAEYDQMIRLGWLCEDDPVELLEGEVVFKMPADPLHDATIERSSRALLKRLGLGEEWSVRIQSAIQTEDSRPEPDIAISTGPSERYLATPPGRGDVALVVEVSNTSLATDRRDKGRIYARAGIGLYWIINLVDAVIEVYTEPSIELPEPAYRRRVLHARSDSIPLVLHGRQVGEIPVSEILAEQTLP